MAIFLIWNPIGARGCVGGDCIGAEERVRKSAVGRLVVRVRVDTSSESDRRSADCHTVLAVVDATAVGEHVDVGTLRAKFAVALQTWWHQESAQAPLRLISATT